MQAAAAARNQFNVLTCCCHAFIVYQAAIDSQLQQCVEAALKCAAVRAEVDAAMTALTQVALYAHIGLQYSIALLKQPHTLTA
jgi:hypothetical protein